METYLPETKGMPEPVFNRIKDINLDKLASSIWLYNRKDWKNKIIVDEINKIEKKDMNFFGDCKRFSAPEFPGLKTELHKHLMSLLPL
jgi:hypothetical protein